MKKSKIPILCSMLILNVLFLSSCSNEGISSDIENLELNEKQLLVKETSILFGKLIVKPDVQKEFFTKIKEVGKDDQAISFSYLLDVNKNLKKNETTLFEKSISKAKKQNLFKDALISEVTSNIELYSEIGKLIQNDEGIKKIVAEDIALELSNNLANEELQIFYPYDEEYADDDRTITDFYVSYDPLNGAPTNEGFEFNDSSTNYTTIPVMDNDFIDEKPVFLIVPIDDCDIEGRPCDFVDLEPIADLPPPYTGSPELLTYNVNHNQIPEGDIISSQIPMIQINGTSWMGFAGTHQKLSFWRGTAATTTAIANGVLVPDPDGWPVKKVRIKRKYIKRQKKWVTIDANFDDDWNMSENTQGMAVFSVHNIAGQASTELSVKSGLKKDENGNVVPTTEPTVTTKVTVSENHSKFRDKIELSRRQVLSTIVGNGLTNETREDNGVNYNVKKIGIVDFYFKYWYTDLTP